MNIAGFAIIVIMKEWMFKSIQYLILYNIISKSILIF